MADALVGRGPGPRRRVWRAALVGLAAVLAVALPVLGQQSATPPAATPPPAAATTITRLPEVVHLFPGYLTGQTPPGSATSPASPRPPRPAAGPTHEIVLVLEPSTPPQGAAVVRVTNAANVVGNESPVFTPARDFELVTDPRPTAPFHGALLACPTLPLAARQAFWIRDLLGDGQWHAGLVVATPLPWTGCPRFDSSPPDAVLLGDHTITVAGTPAQLQRYEQLRLGSDYERGVVRVVGTNFRIVPLTLCVDGQAAVVTAVCPAGARVCEYALQRFGACAP